MSTYRADLALSQTFQRLSGDLVPLGHSVFLDQTWCAEGTSAGALTGVNDIIDSKYRVLSLLGEGGMGSVYRVRHLLLNKEMALKTFRRASLSPDVWQRFQREAQTIARLTHLNIVQVFDFGIAEGNKPYYTMALLEGESLAERIKRQKRLSLREALPVFDAVAGALSHAHKLGIVHRDVKPANIFLDHNDAKREIVKVVDFGLAKLATVTADDSQGREQQAATDAGLVFGSPLYMSPEQANGKAIDARTDIYSYGCTLFEALTGEPPFVGDNAFATIQMHLFEEVPRLSARCPEAAFPPAMENVIARLLAKESQERYQSFDQVQADLSRIELLLDGRISRTSNKPLPVLAESEADLAADFAQTGSFTADIADCEGHDQNRAFTRPRQLVTGPILLSAWSCFVLLFLLLLNWPGTCKWLESLGSLSGGEKTSPASDATTGGAAPVAYRYVTSDDLGRRRFTFPVNAKIGYLSWVTASGWHKPVAAEGTILVPANARVTLDVSDDLNNRPQLLAGFAAEDIFGVTLNTETTWNPKLFDGVVTYLPTVSALTINSSNFDRRFIDQLNRFKNLCSLDLDDSNVNGADLLHFARLRKLIHLNIGGMKNASLVIQALKGNQEMVDIHISDCELDDDDMQALSTYPNLRMLNLNRSSITLKGLRALSKSPQLCMLSVSPGPLRASIIGVLASFKKLRCLHVDTYGWSDGDKNRLKKTLPPGCLIFESGPSFSSGYRRMFK
ncbi:MAG: protein kinase [Cyanobacteria bacterium REEB67]|nr:protein kinase [Cyanobacteria bacterium REEB67]